MALGALMNTRGLTELIVVTVGLNYGVVSPALFTMLVLVALVTTFMAGPALNLIDPGEKLSGGTRGRAADGPAGSRARAVDPDRSNGRAQPERPGGSRPTRLAG
jgi:hypothetical protein